MLSLNLDLLTNAKVVNDPTSLYQNQKNLYLTNNSRK